jgi:glutaredoxin-like protein NrdH
MTTPTDSTLQTSTPLEITVYTNPNCVQCIQTKKYFDANEVPYSVVDLSEDKAALDMVLELGFTSAPVVIANKEKWSGFRMGKLSDTVHAYKLSIRGK